jgi:hypothetical protein
MKYKSKKMTTILPTPQQIFNEFVHNLSLKRGPLAGTTRRQYHQGKKKLLLNVIRRGGF